MDNETVFASMFPGVSLHYAVLVKYLTENADEAETPEFWQEVRRLVDIARIMCVQH